MTANAASADLRKQLSTLSGIGVVGNLSDGSLLERMLHERDEAAQAAFTVLVERHGPMVLGVCRQARGQLARRGRCVSGDVHGAGPKAELGPQGRVGGELAARGRASSGEASEVRRRSAREYEQRSALMKSSETRA